MTIELNPAQILGLMDRPAFWVTDGVVREVNAEAAARFITPGTGIRSLIVSGWGEYEQFSSGCLYLTIGVGSMRWSGSVTRLGDGDLFALDREDNASEAVLRGLSLAARELRQPLGMVLNVSDQLFPAMSENCNSDTALQLARMNQGLHQMLRLVGNMSDTANAGISRMELRDITAVVQEILEHARELCRNAGVELSFENHPASVYTLLDCQRLERALYNLISNALKYTVPGESIAVRLRRRANTVFLTVENPVSMPDTAPCGDLSTRYLREPGLENTRCGIGLGLPLVWKVVDAHQGRLLVEQPRDGGFRITISLPIRQESGTFRSPIVRVDYAGERDHGLIELSESLPPECFLPKKE